MHACIFVSSYVRNNWYHPVLSISQIVELLSSIHVMSVWCVCYPWFQWPAAAILLFWVKFGTLMEDVVRWVEWRTKFVVHFNTPQNSPALGSVLVQIMAWSRFGASHYPIPCSLIVNWILTNKVQWNLNQNTEVFIQENAFEMVVCEMAAILSRLNEDE